MKVSRSSQYSQAMLVWCNGSILTLTKLKVRVQFPSPASQSWIDEGGLLVSTKAGLNTSKGPEQSGPFLMHSMRLVGDVGSVLRVKLNEDGWLFLGLSAIRISVIQDVV